MVAVAQTAGVSRAALYKHFAGKTELLQALHDFVVAEWRAWTKESISAAESAPDAIGRWFREGLADTWRVTAVRVITSDETQGEILTDHDALHDAHSILAEMLKSGVDAGELRADLDVAATAYGLQALLMGLLRNRASERPIGALEGQHQVDAVVEMLLAGLIAKGSS